ncbi:hypothetical protein Pla123a_25900 [Posidoniimonas polymericola]|uniref:Transposase IS30-like HTH domain-containing protein n=1 Tax=Posidoniimonas polymericola TaxID=2528002 RepID=A0A5C5YM27_9BACT|nr:helix-turn-helix domain-containing protein [Posidoniimonas polymericola]TWT75808.1 hypothetical protein Pla123a_25900 [Posidoniimonas polymericola]
MARPRVLDEGKQREVCALLTAGMTVREAADYLGCCEKTIRREQRRDEGFDERVRRARMHARLGPLQAVRQAAATHWRAAAWLVDRQDRQEERERRARREQVKRKQQRPKPKPHQPPQPWDLEQEIQAIASARPAAGERCAIDKSPRRQPREPAATAGLPQLKRRSPVAAALNELAEGVAASARRGTKPPVRRAPGSVVEPAVEGQDEAATESDGGGFVPSLRVFGQNEGERHAPCHREPPASAGGAEPSAAACREGCSGG